MNIIKYTLNHVSFFILLMVVVWVGGIDAYYSLGRLEYPTFTIKKAVIATRYAGATAREVEQEVTDKIEEEIQKMSQLDNITSISRNDMSLIYVEIRPEFQSDEIQQIWDELRRKVNDVRTNLPSDVSPSRVIDDFGDVYGIFLSISGEGYTHDELKDYVKILKKEILRVKDVAKVATWGDPDKAIYVEFNRSKLSNLQISHDEVFQTLSSNNMVMRSGQIKNDDEYCAIRVSGEIEGVEAISNLCVSDNQGRIIRLGDIANVYRGHIEPEDQIMKFNGAQAIGLGISIVDGGNVIALGKNIKKLLNTLSPTRPVGIDINYINYQSEKVEESINEFLVNLLESVLIVIGVLLLTMGLRSGLVIGITLILIILGTFVGMNLFNIDMQLVSLGALIIALGMLVDNAIVVVDGYLVKTAKGHDRIVALKEIVTQTQWPLLGATIVAILAFLAVGFNPGNVGEFCRSLFYMMTISLFLSWIFAITFTPLLCLWLIPVQPQNENEIPEVYSGIMYRGYRKCLIFTLTHKIGAFLVLGLMVFGAVWAYQYVPKNFFPNSTRRQFYVDYWRNSASHIRETAQDCDSIAAYIRSLPGVKSTTTFVGEGALRFILSYDYNNPSPDFGQILVEVDHLDDISALLPQVENHITNNYPSADARVQRFTEGVAIPFKIEARFRGPNHTVLRQLAKQARDIMVQNTNTQYVRDDWRSPVKAVRLQYSEFKARETGISRQDIARSLNWNFNGITCNILRDGTELIPVISRPIESERNSMDQLENIRIWSQAGKKSYSLMQACDDVKVVWEDALIRHRDRIPTITVQCSQRTGTAVALRHEMKKQIEAIELPPLYTFEWGGEYEENKKAQDGLKTLFPISLILMFLVVAMLFHTIREPIVAFATLPFAIIGVVGGLLMFNLPFGFMAILGFLGLSGMLLKNAIVLLDQINIEMKSDKTNFESVVQASVSRLRPVAMAAGTTILGVFPLVFHPFFDAMATTIMFGLLGASILTLFLVPLIYVVLFRVSVPIDQEEVNHE